VEAAPKVERLHFGRDTRNLRRCFRRFLGRSRKSRRREAAGRRNYPEAVLNGKGGKGEDVRNASLGMGNGATGRVAGASFVADTPAWNWAMRKAICVEGSDTERGGKKIKSAFAESGGSIQSFSHTC